MDSNKKQQQQQRKRKMNKLQFLYLKKSNEKFEDYKMKIEIFFWKKK